MGSSSSMWDQLYCRLPSQQTECDSRRSQDGPLGMQASSLVVSDNLLTKGNPRDRSICLDLFDLSHQIKT